MFAMLYQITKTWQVTYFEQVTLSLVEIAIKITMPDGKVNLYIFVLTVITYQNHFSEIVITIIKFKCKHVMVNVDVLSVWFRARLVHTTSPTHSCTHLHSGSSLPYTLWE